MNKLVEKIAVTIIMMISMLGGLFTLAEAVKVEAGRPQPTAVVDKSNQQSEPLPLTVVYKPISQDPQIREAFVVHVEIKLEPDVQLKPMTYKDRLGDWEILNIEKGQVENNNGIYSRIDKLTLISYLPGQIEIPSIPFGFETKDKQGEYRPLPITVKVDGLQPKKGDQPGKLRGLKAPQGMVSWWLVALITLVLLVIGGGLWWWLKRQGLINVTINREPARPAEEIAFERLERIKKSRLIEQGRNKLYYIQLTDILRRYIEGRYIIHAIDRTTHELARALKKTACPRAEIVKITGLLSFSDLVKFAKAGAELKEADSHWQVIWEFVEKTTPQVIDEEEQ